MVDKSTGERSNGCSINYFFWENGGKNLESSYHIGTGAGGVRPSKAVLDIAQRQNIEMLPAVYDAEFIISTGSDGKPVLKPTEIFFKNPVKFVSFEVNDNATFTEKPEAKSDANAKKVK